MTALALAACLAAAACSSPSLDPAQPRRVDCPAAPGSQAPNLTAGLDGEIYLTWIEPRESGHALRFSTWIDEGWSAPRTIAEGSAWFVNWADFPSMAALEDGTLAAHWLARSGQETYAYDVMIALSRDGGATWSAPLRPHRDGTETEHGFVSIVPTPENRFGIVWLDGRDTAGTPPGPMTLRSATLLPSGELVSEAQVDERVCDCCATDAIRTGDGAILVVYRDRSETETRDISASRLERATWTDPVAVHADGWEIGGCPVNGPALAGLGDLVAVAWFTAARDTPIVRVAFSHDGGRSFDSPVRVDLGRPLGRVDLELLDDGTALVSWLERDGADARIYIRRVTPTGPLDPRPVAATSAARSSGFPRMVRRGDQIIIAWTKTGEPLRVVTSVVSSALTARK